MRIRAEWVDMLRMAYKHNPAFQPDVDLTTMKEPQLIELACRSASGLISGWIWKQVDEWVQEIVQASGATQSSRWQITWGLRSRRIPTEPSR